MPGPLPTRSRRPSRSRSPTRSSRSRPPRPASDLTTLEDDGLPQPNGPRVTTSRARCPRGHHGQGARRGWRARRSASAPATTPTGRDSSTSSCRSSRRRGATVDEPVIYDIDQPSYDSEAEQITSGNPDAFVIIDFPETFNKVSAALVRTGSWDQNKTFITDGLIERPCRTCAGADVVEGLRGTAPGTPDTGEAIDAFDNLFTTSDPKDVEAADVRCPELRRRDSLLPGGGCRRVRRRAPTFGTTSPAVSGPPGDKFTLEQMPETITALQNGEDIDYEGASGPIDLDENGDPQAALYSVNQFKGGELTPVGKPIGGQPRRAVASRKRRSPTAIAAAQAAGGSVPGRFALGGGLAAGRSAPCRRGRARRPSGRRAALARAPRSGPCRGRGRSRDPTSPAPGARSARPSRSSPRRG